MGNHVHLLIKVSSETLDQIMKRIFSSYVYYYNHKYGRIGHLFQEQFKSQPVGDWDYFLTLLRYIHQNPLKPHLVTSLREYKSVWRYHRCWVSTIATTAAEAISSGSPWKRNWTSRIVPPYKRTIFHRTKGNKCRKWEKTSVGNGMWIYPWRRRLVFLLLTWWIRALPGVLISLRPNESGTCPLTLPARHSNRLTVINPSNFVGSLQYLSPWPCWGIMRKNRLINTKYNIVFLEFVHWLVNFAAKII